MPVQGQSKFQKEVFEVVKGIPRGQVMTYSEVAKVAGRPLAYRAVGNILHGNYNPAVPCHRVVRTDGKLGGYNRGEEKKRQRLIKEGCGLARFSER
jgi:methylated-DNA-[protein]-cysteine S-methyltransferase